MELKEPSRCLSYVACPESAKYTSWDLPCRIWITVPRFNSVYIVVLERPSAREIAVILSPRTILFSK